jgi:predicted acylesterase/phospholipase RssA
MKGKSSSEKSRILKTESDKIFDGKKFDAFKTDIGIVSLNYDTQKPLIFKTNPKQAHGMVHSFEPGFGKTISEAVQCSCAAYPIFEIINIDLINKSSVTNVNVIDGGFIANDPILFALIDANKAFRTEVQDIRLISVGVGEYVEKPFGFWYNLLRKVNMIKFVERVLTASTNTNVLVAKLLFPNLKIVRISEKFPEPEHGTNMTEMDMVKLKKLNSLGRSSFAKQEKEIDALLKS